MSPKKEIIEILELDSLKPTFSRINKNHYTIGDNINIKDLEKQKRITIYHYVVHILAFLLIIPYISLIVCNIPVPISFSTIVSIVIGFYFARSLFN